MNQFSIPSKLTYEQESVKDKAIVITGGTTGIGRSTALLLAAQGARVLIFGRHEKELQDTLNDFAEANLADKVHSLIADTSKKEDIIKIFEKADEELDGVDILINNAALGYKSILEGNFEEWQYVVDCNIMGYMACAHEAIARMKRKGSGHIVNIGSMSADVHEKGSSVYVATKAAIQGFSASLRKEVNELGIKVTLIEPGAVGTSMPAESPSEQRRQQDELMMLKAEDIAACILYSLTQPKRCDVIVVQIRPHLQLI